MASRLKELLEASAIVGDQYRTFQLQCNGIYEGYDLERKKQFDRKVQYLIDELKNYAQGKVILIKGYVKVRQARNPTITQSKPFKYYIHSSEEDAKEYFEKIVKLHYIIDMNKTLSIESIPTGQMLIT